VNALPIASLYSEPFLAEGLPEVFTHEELARLHQDGTRGDSET
jgi:hypothetical protein